MKIFALIAILSTPMFLIDFNDELEDIYTTDPRTGCEYMNYQPITENDRHKGCKNIIY